MKFHTEHIDLQVNAQQIALLTFNAEQASVNLLSQVVLQQLGQAIQQLSHQVGIRALVLRSAKESFIPGADINEFTQAFSGGSDAVEHWLHQAHQVFSALEQLPYPTASAINGFCLGGGCELVLATDYRIASPDLQIGLPEVKLGIFPGFGGSCRLPRLLGIDSALGLISSGQVLSAERALALGLVDAISDDVEGSALQMLQQLPRELWQTRRATRLAALPINTTEAKLALTSVMAQLSSKVSAKHLPAPFAAVQVVADSWQLPLNEALLIEQQSFAKLCQHPSARHLVGVYLAEQRIKGLMKLAAGSAKRIEHIGVVGAGTMGGGIAYQALSSGYFTSLSDLSQGALGYGNVEIHQLYQHAVEKGKCSASAQLTALARLQLATDNQIHQQAQVVIEAVVEKISVKQQVLQQLENIVPSDSILATNTSTLPINELAANLQRPAQFCGMHFFNPVHRMPLVEVIRGTSTAETTINQVVAVAQHMGKRAIVVNDCAGFFVNRVLFPYLLAFDRLLQQGVNLHDIEKAASDFGWPMGPARLLDEIGIDVALHAAQVMSMHYPERMPLDNQSQISALFYQGHLGRKSGKGFYLYDGNHSKTNSALSCWKNEQQLPTEQIQQLLLVPMAIEVLFCLEEGIIANAEQADMALIYGLGFPAFRGGLCTWLDEQGAAQIETYLQQDPLLGSGRIGLPQWLLHGKTLRGGHHG